MLRHLPTLDMVTVAALDTRLAACLREGTSQSTARHYMTAVRGFGRWLQDDALASWGLRRQSRKIVRLEAPGEAERPFTRADHDARMLAWEQAMAARVAKLSRDLADMAMRFDAAVKRGEALPFDPDAEAAQDVV